MTRMRHWQGRAAVGVVVSAVSVLAGCAGGGGGRGASDAGVNYDVPKPKPAAVTSGGTAAKPGTTSAQPAGYDEMPTPPADAQYTIYCQIYTGPDHQDVARQVRDVLRRNTPLNKWYVVHGDEQSTLYYGFYRTIDKRDPSDAKEGERALADLDAVRTLTNSQGGRLFAQSLPVPIDSPDPAANPAWDITKSGAYWSLCVATFKDTPDRKLRAVQAVAEARRQGVDAYYYHGPRTSDVCVGAWPESAAAEVNTAQQNVDPNRPLLVTPVPVDPAFAQKMDPNVQTAAPRVDPVDPSLIQAMSQWRTHAVNGYTLMKRDPVTGRETDEPIEPSFLFKVPTATDAEGGNGGAGSVVDTTPPPAAPTPTAAVPGAGQLRSLDDH